MSAASAGSESDPFSAMSTPEALQNVLRAILDESKEEGAPGYYFEDPDEDMRNVTLFTHGPLIVPVNFNRFITVTEIDIREDEEFEDAEGIGLNADNQAALLIQPDSRNQLERRELTLSFSTINPSNQRKVYNEWLIEYRPETGHRIFFYKGLKQRGAEPNFSFRQPAEEDTALFTAVLEHAANVYFSDDESDEHS